MKKKNKKKKQQKKNKKQQNKKTTAYMAFDTSISMPRLSCMSASGY